MILRFYNYSSSKTCCIQYVPLIKITRNIQTYDHEFHSGFFFVVAELRVVLIFEKFKFLTLFFCICTAKKIFFELYYSRFFKTNLEYIDFF